MRKQTVMSQMKGQDKIPEKQLNELMIDNFPGKKKNQNNESESDSGSRKKSEGKD